MPRPTPREKYLDVQVSQDGVHGHPGRALVGLSARADRVVIGWRSTHAGQRGPGTVTHAVLNHAHGPIVTVPLMTGPESFCAVVPPLMVRAEGPPG